MVAIVDCRLPSDCVISLEAKGFEVIPLPPFHRLAAPVASHPDMLMFICGKYLLTHSDYYKTAKPEIDRIVFISGLTLLLSDEPIDSSYPQDIIFNAAKVGKYIFAKKSSISRHIIDLAEQHSMVMVDIKQGYARCSTAIAGDNAIITSDIKIAAAAKAHGIDSLLISPGHIKLDGYDTGFIGGTSGTLGRCLYFCGELDTHPDAYAIRTFCRKHGVQITELGKGQLFDAGSIFFV